MSTRISGKFALYVNVRSAEKMKRKIILSVTLSLMLVGGIFGLLAWRHKLRNRCTNQLRQLYCPMECCIPMEYGLTNGAALDPLKVAQYMKDGKIPKCPCGPEYEIIWVVGGPHPKCPYHGDLLAAISNINNHKRLDVRGDKQPVYLQEVERVQSEPDVIIAKAIKPYRAKPYSELVKMVGAEPNTIDVKWSCSKAYQVAVWAMWANEPNGNICVIGMVNAKEGNDTLIPPFRSFIKSPFNQFVGEQDRLLSKPKNPL